jgi:hypothetical protein
MRRVLNGTDTPEDLMLVRLAIGANNSSAVQLYRMVPNHRRSDPEAMQRLSRALSIGSLQNANTAATQSQSTLGLPAASAQYAERRGPTLPTTAPTLNVGPFQEAEDRTMSEAFLRNQNQIVEGTGDWQVGLDHSGHGSANVTPSNTQHTSDLPGGSEQNRLPPLARNESNRSLALRGRPVERANSQQPDPNRRGIASHRSRASGTVPSRSTVPPQPPRETAPTQSSTSQGGSSQTPNNRTLESAESGQSPRNATRQGGSSQSPRNATRQGGSSQSPRNATRQGGSSQSPRNAIRQGGSSQSLESAESGQSSANQGQPESGTELQNTAARPWCRIS